MQNLEHDLWKLQEQIRDIEPIKVSGKIIAVRGNVLEAAGISEFVKIGYHCLVKTDSVMEDVLTEVVGFEHGGVLLMPFTDISGVGAGCEVIVRPDLGETIMPDESWLGRIIDGFANPIDDKGLLRKGTKSYPLRAAPPPSQKRRRVGGKMDLGVKSINSFVSCCLGQRMGIFAGSGVGKSVLISMLTKYADADIKVIALVGERSREVKEFVEEYLGPEGVKKAIIVVATGDEPALMRKRAAYTSMVIAEYFRDQGKEVLCILDSVTRFAMAQREIGLAAGEPPTTKGYTPSVFAELPKLLERAGPGTTKGNITGLFTVLVEGDDHNEPISDAVRGILDGHIVLDRKIGERGRFPAVDILRSVSRTLPGCNTEWQNKLVSEARRVYSLYNDMSEMIRIGAYKKGSDEELDKAIELFPKLEEFLKQQPTEHQSMEDSYIELAKILNFPVK